MVKTVALLFLMACLCSGQQNCPQQPKCKFRENFCAPPKPGKDKNNCRLVGTCVPRHYAFSADGKALCFNYCLPPIPDNHVHCPPTYKPNGCMNRPRSAPSLDKCPKSIYGSNGCKLPANCKDDEQKCPGPKPHCCPREDFCIPKLSSKTGRNGKKCPLHCHLNPIPPGQGKCPDTYDSNGCPLPPMYVDDIKACPASLYNGNGCWVNHVCNQQEISCINHTVPKVQGCPHHRDCLPKYGPIVKMDKYNNSCQNQCPKTDLSQGSVCPTIYSSRGCPMPAESVQGKKTCPTSPYDSNGCYKKTCKDDQIFCSYTTPSRYCPRTYCKTKITHVGQDGQVCPTHCVVPTPPRKKEMCWGLQSKWMSGEADFCP